MAAPPTTFFADPPAATVPAAGGVSNHMLANPTGERIVFKVKCSDNALYRIMPVVGFVDPQMAMQVQITRKPGAPKVEKMNVHFAPAPPGAVDANAAFASIKPTGLLTIQLTAA